MSEKEKQIEEMAKILCPCYETDRCDIGCDRYYGCSVVDDATDMYNAGYRKQSEGEWEQVRRHKECSKCHYNAPYQKIKVGYHLQDLTPYCPNCGAKMKGGAE